MPPPHFFFLSLNMNGIDPILLKLIVEREHQPEREREEVGIDPILMNLLVESPPSTSHGPVGIGLLPDPQVESMDIDLDIQFVDEYKLYRPSIAQIMGVFNICGDQSQPIIDPFNINSSFSTKALNDIRPNLQMDLIRRLGDFKSKENENKFNPPKYGYLLNLL